MSLYFGEMFVDSGSEDEVMFFILQKFDVSIVIFYDRVNCLLLFMVDRMRTDIFGARANLRVIRFFCGAVNFSNQIWIGLVNQQSFVLIAAIHVYKINYDNLVKKSEYSREISAYNHESPRNYYSVANCFHSV